MHSKNIRLNLCWGKKLQRIFLWFMEEDLFLAFQLAPLHCFAINSGPGSIHGPPNGKRINWAGRHERKYGIDSPRGVWELVRLLTNF